MKPNTIKALLLTCAAPLVLCADSQPVQLVFRGADHNTPVIESTGRVSLPAVYPGIEAVF